MGSRYAPAASEVAKMAKKLIEQFHMDLDSAAVKIDYIFAFAELIEKGDNAGEKKAPAIMHQGYRALGVARILALKDRVMGRGDGEIVLDGDDWPHMSEDEQKALLDHELEHFEVKRDKEGNFLYDDIDRPLLKLRKHDVQAGWFTNIAARHGTHSQEVKQFRQIVTDPEGQCYFAALINSVNELPESLQGLKNYALEGSK